MKKLDFKKKVGIANKVAQLIKKELPQDADAQNTAMSIFLLVREILKG